MWVAMLLCCFVCIRSEYGEGNGDKVIAWYVLCERARPQAGEVRVVSGRGVGHRARATRVQMAQVERQLLHLVVRDLAIVTHCVVARRPGRTLQSLVRHLQPHDC